MSISLHFSGYGYVAGLTFNLLKQRRKRVESKRFFSDNICQKIAKDGALSNSKTAFIYSCSQLFGCMWVKSVESKQIKIIRRII